MNGKLPKVKIIILNWHGLLDTIGCLKSLQKICYSHYQVIVVDNGSLGNDADILKKKFGDYIKLIRNEVNLGFAGGNNTAFKEILKEGKTDYVLLLNNDTIVEKDFLTKLVDKALEHSEAGIIGSKIINENTGEINFAGGKINWWLARPHHLKKDNRKYTDFVTGCAMLIPVEVLKETGLFDPVYFCYFEDADLCQRVKATGKKLIVAQDSIVYHKISRSSKTRSPFYIYHFSRNRLIFNYRYNKNRFKSLTFITIQIGLKTVLARIIFPKVKFQSWLRGIKDARMIIKREKAQGNKSKKIGFFYEPSISYGIKNYQENLYTSLKKIGLNLELIYYEENKFTEEVENKLHLKYLDFLKESVKLKKALYRIVAPFEIKKRYSLLIYPYQFHPVINPYDLKIISVVHDLIPLRYSPSILMKFVYRHFLGRILRKSDKVVAISSVTERDLIQKYHLSPGLIEKINSGVSEKFRSYSTEKRDYFLTFDRKEVWKNTNFVLDCFNKYGKLSLTVIGNEERQNNNINFIKDVNDERLIDLYNRSLGLLFLSSDEGFGFPIIEAQRCGCPVITLHSKNMPKEIISKTVILSKLNCDELYRLLIRLRDEKQFRDRVIEDGLSYSRQYSWDIAANQFKKLVASLV
ncbi:MAG: glycosyltransferase [Patescibacteria group bacterium]